MGFLRVPRGVPLLLGVMLVLLGVLVLLFAPRLLRAVKRSYSFWPAMARLMDDPAILVSSKIAAAVSIVLGIALVVIGATSR